MSEETSPLPQNESERLEAISKLNEIFTEAERVLETEGREKAKVLLPGIYDGLRGLNASSKEETTIKWNPDGNLTEEEFDKLNLRRKLLSNAIGILTASGEVRHDLNKI